MRRHAGAAGVALLALAVPARADEPRVALRWTAPEGCPAGSRVVAEVDRLLGAHGARPARPLEVKAEVIAGDAGALRVHLEIEGDAGPRTRDLSAASCDALADAAALILAMTIDPAAVTAAPPPVRPLPAPPPPTPLPPPPPPPPLPAPAPSLRPRFHLAAWARADLGSLPGVSFAAGGTAALGLGALRVELGAGAAPARTQAASRPAASGATAGGEISLIAGSAGLCYGVLPEGRLELSPCAAIELGRLHAAGFGVTTPGEGNVLWSAARLGARFAWWPMSRAAIVLRAEAAVPFARPTFVLEGLGTVHRPGPVAGRLGGELEMRF